MVEIILSIGLLIYVYSVIAPKIQKRRLRTIKVRNK